MIYSYQYMTEFQTEGVLTLKAFADKAKDIYGTVSNSLSADLTECPDWVVLLYVLD